MVISALKGGMMTTKKMAEMMRQMPKPKDSSGGDETEKALLAFSDKELQGKGFIPWKAYKHPTLGEVEIGGFVPYTANTPPAAMMQNLLQGQVPWVLHAGRKTAPPAHRQNHQRAPGQRRFPPQGLGGELGLPAVPHGHGQPQQPHGAGRHHPARRRRHLCSKG